MAAGPYPTKAQFLAQTARIDALEQNPGGGGGYSEIMRLGMPFAPSPTGDVIDAIGFEFVSALSTTVTAVRLWARLPDDAANDQVEANVRLIVNDDDLSNIPITVRKGAFAEVTAYLAGPVTIAADDRVGVVLQNSAPGGSPHLLGGYTEAGGEYYGIGYQELTGYLTNVSVSEPLSYVRVAHADTGDTYPALQLLSTTGTPQLLPHATFRRTFGTPDGAQPAGWTLRDGRTSWGTLPAVVDEFEGRLYEAPLWPVDPATTAKDPFGTYVPVVTSADQIGRRRMAWVNGQLMVTDAQGNPSVVMFATPE